MPTTRDDPTDVTDVPSEDGKPQVEEDKTEVLAPVRESTDKTTSAAHVDMNPSTIVDATRAARKRGREGSTEPGAILASASSSSTSMHRLAVKKNRVEPSSSTTAATSLIDDDHTPQPTTDEQTPQSNADSSIAEREAGNIGEVRKKVAKMNWKEGAAGKKIRGRVADDAMSVASERGADEGGHEDEEEDEEDEEEVEDEDEDAGDKGKEDGEDSSGDVEDNRQVEIKSDIIEDHKMASSTSASSPAGAGAASADHQMQQDQSSAAVSELGTPEDVVDIEDGGSPTTAVESQNKKSASLTPDSMDLDPETGKKRKLLERHSSTTLSTNTSAKGDDKAKRLKETNVLETSVRMEDKETLSSKSALETDATPKKSQPTFASFSSTTSPFGVKPTSSVGHTPNTTDGALSSTSSAPAAAAAATPKKPPPTFGSFTSSASPFGAVKPSSSAFSSQPVASTSTAATSFKSTSSKAFGGWSVSSGASPFATPVKKKEVKDVDEEKEQVKPSGSFEDILTSSKADEEEKTAKVAVTEKEHRTGEEDEDTVYQVRCKLYVMETNGSWRERGTGSLHLNTSRDHARAARLVMRAEGVLRLILNVALFPGMTCEITGDKYLKTVVLESGELKSFLIKVGSTKAANELKQQILDYVPDTKTALEVPSPRAEAAEDAEEKV